MTAAEGMNEWGEEREAEGGKEEATSEGGGGGPSDLSPPGERSQ